MNLIYGIIIDNMFYSNRMERKISAPNGIYSLDIEVDDFIETLEIADITEAIKYFRKASKIVVVRGVSFGDGMIPENPVSYNQIPIPVLDPQFEEFECVECAIVKGKVCYFLQTVVGDNFFKLDEVREKFESKESIDDLKGVTPEMRVAFTLHSIRREQEELAERLRQEAERKAAEQERILREERTPKVAITRSFESAGANVRDIKKERNGWSVTWTCEGHTINTLLNSDYSVANAGFCVSGYDNTQSTWSVCNLFKDYIEQGEYIHLTRILR